MTKNPFLSGNELSLSDLATVAAGKDGEPLAGKQVGEMTLTELEDFYEKLQISYCISDGTAELTFGLFAVGIPFELKTVGL